MKNFGRWVYKKEWDNFRGVHFISIKPAKQKDADDTIAGIWSTDEVDYANAKLIASAPELLEVCQEVKYKLEYECHTFPEFIELLDNAIKKATE